MKQKRGLAIIWSWALYDFANTIFSMNVVSRYFPLWVTKTHGAPDIYYSFALSGSMLMVALSLPVFGAVSDQTGRRIRPLVILTLICALMTALIGSAGSLAAGLILFALANYCYQSALVFYDGLLPSVSSGSTVAKVAGLGVSLGYLGAIAGLLMAIYMENIYGIGAVYIGSAIMFVLFSLPIFFKVPDTGARKKTKVDFSLAIGRVKQTFAHAREHRNLFIFMVANLFILDAVNTVIAFMSVYANAVFGLSGALLNIFLMTATGGAAIGSFLWGWVTNRVGALSALQLVCVMWLFIFVFAALAPNRTLFWAVGPLAGVALGGVWVAGRTLLVDLAPADRVGEFFGFYYLAGKFSSVIGPIIWGLTVAALAPLGGTIKHRVAVASLALFILFGWRLLKKIEVGRS